MTSISLISFVDLGLYNAVLLIVLFFIGKEYFNIYLFIEQWPQSSEKKIHL